MIELLVVTAIIGVLAAIAVPQFKEYRARAYDARAQSDLRNAMTAQEAYFLDFESYSASVERLPGFVLSEGVNLAVRTVGETDWAGSSYHERGTKTFCFDAADGKPLSSQMGLGSCN
ncbi:MAG: hypothetical protein KDD69_13350 [Bdellovibrionales bacterium]|nr:hypothetical protein [Bdellovibrionales bacterium]